MTDNFSKEDEKTPLGSRGEFNSPPSVQIQPWGVSDTPTEVKIPPPAPFTEQERGRTSDETTNLCSDLANLCTYYLYAVLDATKESAPSLINLLVRLQKQAQEEGDTFHASFFFTFAELLRTKYGQEGGKPAQSVGSEELCRGAQTGQRTPSRTPIPATHSTPQARIFIRITA